ncbi:MAG: hypothetical protein ACYDCO_17530 [Armatimonadota bacterium]
MPVTRREPPAILRPFAFYSLISALAGLLSPLHFSFRVFPVLAIGLSIWAMRDARGAKVALIVPIISLLLGLGMLVLLIAAEAIAE